MAHNTTMVSFRNVFFPRLPRPISDEELERKRDRRVRNIVATLSVGNVALQRGAFTMESDVEKLRKKNEKRDGFGQ